MKKRTIIGIVLILLGIVLGIYAVYEILHDGQARETEKPQAGSSEETLEEKEKLLDSVSGRKFGTASDNCFFYDDSHVVVTVETRDKFGETYLDRSLYEYRIKDDRLSLKSQGMKYSVPFSFLEDGILLDQREYPLMAKEKNVPEVVGNTYRRGMETYRFIDSSSVVVTLNDDGEKIREAWGYDLSEHRIVFTYGAGGARGEHPFQYVEKGIKIGDEVYEKE